MHLHKYKQYNENNMNNIFIEFSENMLNASVKFEYVNNNVFVIFANNVKSLTYRKYI